MRPSYCFILAGLFFGLAGSLCAWQGQPVQGAPAFNFSAALLCIAAAWFHASEK